MGRHEQTVAGSAERLGDQQRRRAHARARIRSWLRAPAGLRLFFQAPAPAGRGEGVARHRCGCVRRLSLPWGRPASSRRCCPRPEPHPGLGWVATAGEKKRHPKSYYRQQRRQSLTSTTEIASPSASASSPREPEIRLSRVTCLVAILPLVAAAAGRRCSTVALPLWA